MDRRVFGQVDGVDVHEVVLRSEGGMEASILTWGAIVRTLLIPTKTGQQNVIVGFETLEDYLADTSYAGTIVGRFANRIAGGAFKIDGKPYQLPLNQDGKHTLHGGGDGEAFGRRLWTIKSQTAASVTMALTSPDGDAGFPGELTVGCTFTLMPDATLRVELAAHTTAPTLCNLTTHCYFNLEMPSGFADEQAPDVRNHHLWLGADFYTPVDVDGIPTGEIRAVAGTAFDFGEAREIASQERLFDHGFILRERAEMSGSLAHASTLFGPNAGLAMDMFTTEPQLQFYDGSAYQGPKTGCDGVRYGAHCGLCLEPQNYPDGPNRSHFPSAILRPNNSYQHVTEYRFRQDVDPDVCAVD